MADKELKAFLRDLTRLSKRHNLFIGGCGCCSSPYVWRKGPAVGNDLSWNRDAKRYEIEEA